MPRRMLWAPARTLISLTVAIWCTVLVQIGCSYSEALVIQSHSNPLAGKWQNKWRQSFQLFHFDENGTFDEVMGGSTSRTDLVLICSGTYTSQGGRLSLALKKTRTFQGRPAAQDCPEVESFTYHFDGPDRLLLESSIGAVVLSRCATGPDNAAEASRRPQRSQLDAADVADKSFWGSCGDVLGGFVTDDDLQRRVRSILRGELEDKKVVEVEITEAVIDRINNWAKMLGFFAGIPMALLLGLLGVLGFRKFSDLSQLVQAAEDKIKPTIDHAEKTATDVERKTSDLSARTREMQSQVEKRFADMGKLFDDLEPRLKESERLAKVYEQRLTEVQNSVDSRVTGLERDLKDIKKMMPGKERWPVKTGTDRDAHLVSAKPVPATLEELVALEPPQDPRDRKLQRRRVGPAELTIYRVEAMIVSVKLQMSGNYTLVLKSENGTTMRAQAPNPDPDFVPSTSRWVTEIASVRKQIDDRIVPTRFITKVRMKARITGVGFFTSLHGQIGVAPNGFELHPVIGIEFLG